MKTTNMTRTEQIQKNIEFLKSLQYWVKGIDDDMTGAYMIAILYLEKKIEDIEQLERDMIKSKAQMEYDYINNIDMSGACGTNDR